MEAEDVRNHPLTTCTVYTLNCSHLFIFVLTCDCMVACSRATLCWEVRPATSAVVAQQPNSRTWPAPASAAVEPAGHAASQEVERTVRRHTRGGWGELGAT